jgi:IS1 family transposase
VAGFEFLAALVLVWFLVIGITVQTFHDMQYCLGLLQWHPQNSLSDRLVDGLGASYGFLWGVAGESIFVRNVCADYNSLRPSLNGIGRVAWHWQGEIKRIAANDQIENVVFPVTFNRISQVKASIRGVNRDRSFMDANISSRRWQMPGIDEGYIRNLASLINLWSADSKEGFFGGAHCLRLILGSDGEIVSVVATDNYFYQGNSADKSQNYRENCDPYGSSGHFPSRSFFWLFLGSLFFALGFASMRRAHLIMDEPSPQLLTRLCAWGIGLVAVGLLFASVWFVVHGLIPSLKLKRLSIRCANTVPQKYLLTSPNYRGTVIVIGRTQMANVLPIKKKVAVISALTEGSGIRQAERMTGVNRETIMKLGVRVGKGCQSLLDRKMRDLSCQHLQFDELWGFVGKKERHVRPDDNPELGDVWTFCAIDSDTKLVPSFKVGKRDGATANAFVADVASRMANRVQISTDGLRSYVEAVEQAFGANVDYAQIVKIFEDNHVDAEVIGMDKKAFTGRPDMSLASTSHVERLNGTTRLHMRRLTRLTYAFSKKRENFEAAVGLHFAYYNFVKRHNSLRMTPAMAAGIERDFWTVRDLVEAAA